MCARLLGAARVLHQDLDLQLRDAYYTREPGRPA